MIEADTLYRKTGRRYQPVGQEFTGFPANGVWLVTDGRQSLIAKLDELPEPAVIASVEMHRDAITDAIRRAVEGHAKATFRVDWEKRDARWEYPALSDIVDAVVKELAGVLAKGRARPDAAQKKPPPFRDGDVVYWDGNQNNLRGNYVVRIWEDGIIFANGPDGSMTEVEIYEDLATLIHAGRPATKTDTL